MFESFFRDSPLIKGNICDLPGLLQMLQELESMKVSPFTDKVEYSILQMLEKSIKSYKIR